MQEFVLSYDAMLQLVDPSESIFKVLLQGGVLFV